MLSLNIVAISSDAGSHVISCNPLKYLLSAEQSYNTAKFVRDIGSSVAVYLSSVTSLSCKSFRRITSSQMMQNCLIR